MKTELRLEDFGSCVKCMKNGILVKSPSPVRHKLCQNFKFARGKIVGFPCILPSVCGALFVLRVRLLKAIFPSRDYFDNSGRCQLVDGYPSKRYLQQVQKAWDRFRFSVRQLLPQIGFVWRIELQARRAPHWHILAFLPKNLPLPDLPEFAYFKPSHWSSLVGLICWLKWRDSLRFWPSETASGSRADVNGAFFESLGGFPGGACVRWQEVASFNAFRYISDHTSKHKQAQLGWRGRQWGYLNRRALAVEKGDLSVLTVEEMSRFLREVSRWNRRHYKGHGRRWRIFSGESTIWFPPADAARLIAWARSPASLP